MSLLSLLSHRLSLLLFCLDEHEGVCMVFGGVFLFNMTEKVTAAEFGWTIFSGFCLEHLFMYILPIWRVKSRVKLYLHIKRGDCSGLSQCRFVLALVWLSPWVWGVIILIICNFNTVCVRLFNGIYYAYLISEKMTRPIACRLSHASLSLFFY